MAVVGRRSIKTLKESCSENHINYLWLPYTFRNISRPSEVARLVYTVDPKPPYQLRGCRAGYETANRRSNMLICLDSVVKVDTLKLTMCSKCFPCSVSFSSSKNLILSGFVETVVAQFHQEDYAAI